MNLRVKGRKGRNQGLDLGRGLVIVVRGREEEGKFRNGEDGRFRRVNFVEKLRSETFEQLKGVTIGGKEVRKELKFGMKNEKGTGQVVSSVDESANSIEFKWMVGVRKIIGP